MVSPTVQEPPISTPAEDSHEPLTADNFDDGDSAYSNPTTAGLTSLRSNVLKFQEENGRTYHSMSGGKYSWPNDQRENERLDLQHNLFLLTFHGELGLSPKVREGAKRVLDAGTGTGAWAVEYADLHPESEVVGVDLSPIQPSLVPPNCIFELDDLEKDWTWARPFDLIMSRMMTGSFSNMKEYIKKAYDNLEPGGYLEMQDLCQPLKSDDGTLNPDSTLARLSDLCIEASKNSGRPLFLAPEYKGYMELAGFVDVVERRFKWPLNEWPKDSHYKELGAWNRVNMDSGMDGLLLALFTRFLGWTSDEVLVYSAEVRNALKDRRVHAYLPIYVVYGRKPGDSPSTAATKTVR